MVSWSEGATSAISGYDPATFKTVKGLYVFATTGQAVDVNAITRLGTRVPEPSEVPEGSPRGLFLNVGLTWSLADFNNNPGKRPGYSVFIAAADTAGLPALPTPAQVVEAAGKPGNTILRQQNSSMVAGGWSYTWDLVNRFPTTPNTKYWIVVMPTMTSPWGTPSVANDKPPAGYTINGIARGLSFWTNRTPLKPTITSPSDGVTVDPGATINFTYQPNDPDYLAPDDSLRRNRDVKGMAVVYSAVPSESNPNPEWLLLPYTLPNGVEGYGSYAWQRVIPSSYYDPSLITDLGLSIKAGSNKPPAGFAGLPAGTWRVRVATVDYDTPFPKPEDMTDEPDMPWWALNEFPGVAWSDPITITVASRVPVPTPISPTAGLALPVNRPVALSWRYRNTNLPPLPQAFRNVQVRKVGDQGWTTAVQNFSSSPSAVVGPPVSGNPNAFHNDGSSTTGWVAVAAGSTGAYIGPGGHVTSSRQSPLWPGEPDPTRTGLVTLSRAITGVTAPGVVTIKGRRRMGQYPVPGVLLSVDAEFRQGGVVQDAVLLSQNGAENTWASDWEDFELVYFVPAVNAVTIRMRPLDEVGADLQIDDLHVAIPDTGFTFEAGNEYEWRVQVADSADEVSGFSAPARFWVVPAPATGDVRPVPTNTLPGATLGCGTHRVFVYRRGGLRRVGEITGLASVEWGRMRDDLSTARIVVADWGIDCGNLLKNLETWAYEIVIFRDNGYSTDRVWEGPITLLTYKRDEVVIQAKDVLGYAYRRVLRQAMNDLKSPRTITARAEQIIQNAYAPDDPNVLANLQILRREDDVLQYRNTPAYSRTAFEELDDMASNSGLDYTTIGRSILVWGTRHRIGTLPEFRDENFGAPPIVSEYGMSMANRYIVSDGNGIWGDATRDLDPVSGNNEKYGLVEMLSSSWASDEDAIEGTFTDEQREKVVQSFKQSSERSISDRYPAPTVVRVPDNTTLNPNTVISIQQLVPGVAIPLRSTGTLREVVGTQKLDSVSVLETEGSETISIILSPFNRDDASMEEGGEE